jgi:flavin reductase (DIM6/NTAB) family NADH-FMN oxidoreductase RutF/rubredoxin
MISKNEREVSMNGKALQKIGYGVYVISSRQGDRMNGQIANTAFQVTSSPETIAISINKQNFTHELIQGSKVFSVSVLGKTAPMTLIGRFGFKSGRDEDKFSGVQFKTGATGSPYLLEHTASYIEGEVINEMDCGTHTVFLGKVVDADVLSDAEPMTYAYYHEIKGGKSPAAAPTYQPDDTPVPQSERYTCSICGYVYDPQKGDPDNNIEAGTDFADISARWLCPICQAPKEKFAASAQ